MDVMSSNPQNAYEIIRRYTRHKLCMRRGKYTYLHCKQETRSYSQMNDIEDATAKNDIEDATATQTTSLQSESKLHAFWWTPWGLTNTTAHACGNSFRKKNLTLIPYHLHLHIHVIQVHILMHIHIQIHIKRPYTYTHIHTHTNTHTIHIRKNAYVYAHTHIHTYTHRNTHTHTHTHIHIHIHMHIESGSPWSRNLETIKRTFGNMPTICTFLGLLCGSIP
jgi:hypothetical protein